MGVTLTPSTLPFPSTYLHVLTHIYTHTYPHMCTMHSHTSMYICAHPLTLLAHSLNPHSHVVTNMFTLSTHMHTHI